MDFSGLKYIYMIGVGGIGMSAIARYFKHSGKTVYGYDKTKTLLTDELIREGIDIHFNDDVSFIPEILLKDENIHETLVIYTPAISSDHKELQFFRSLYYSVFKRAEILGFITNKYRCIAVAGTHGKTTITAMIAHILKLTDEGCTAFIGGISKNYNTNFLFSDKPQYIVVEADEYDRSFLKLNPEIAVISSIDADHLDIYGTKNEVILAFNQFAEKIQLNGKLFIKSGLDVAVPETIQKYSYSVNDYNSDFYICKTQKLNQCYRFDVRKNTGEIYKIELKVPGLYNVENALVAFSVGMSIGLNPDIVIKGLESFSGIKRRFDYQINDKVIMIDDYAHHPREIRACLESVRDIYPDRRITGIFQPHLYSRTRDFADEFSESLNLLDNLILLDIYPAREIPLNNVTSKLIYDKVKIKNKKLILKSDLIDELDNQDIDVLVTMGAGDIDQLIEPIKQKLIIKYNIKK
ncbi:MAG: UDP-N-acetylmuramate--L-alanine ligase [Bacteroidota bacterium]